MSTQWEYDISALEGHEYHDPANFKESLETWGREGWELACTIELMGPGGPTEHVILKRPHR